MKSRDKLVLIIFIVILIIAVLVSVLIISHSQQKQNSETVTYAAPLTLAAAPIYVADAKGFWHDAGINVKVSYFSSGAKALDALLANDAEVMSVSETPPLRAYLNGAKINIISTMTEHREAKLTVRTNEISKPQDMVGKKIGTVPGTNSDYYM